MSTYCVELLSLRADRTKILLIRQRPSGHFLQRVNQRGEWLRDTQHDEMDDAMRRAYSKYGPISDSAPLPG